MTGAPVPPPSTKKLPTSYNEESLWKHPLSSSMEQLLLLCLHRSLKSSLTCHGHHCCVTCRCTMDTSSSKKDSPILGKLARITSSLLVYRGFRVSKVSGLVRDFRLKQNIAEEKTKPTDLKMSPLYLNKSLLNISVIVFCFWSGLFPFLCRH